MLFRSVSQSRYSGALTLEDLADLLSIPNKIGVGGKNVHHEYYKNNMKGIVSYCKIDSLITLISYLKYTGLTTDDKELKAVMNGLVEIIKAELVNDKDENIREFGVLM